MLVATREFHADPDLPAKARRWVRAWLFSAAADFRDAGPFVEDVVLCVSEMIADALMVGAEKLSTGIGLADDRAVISVVTAADIEAAPESELSRAAGAERMRRHDLLGALASRRGEAHDDAGRELWVEVRRPNTRSGARPTSPGREIGFSVSVDRERAGLELIGELDVSAVPRLRSALAETLTELDCDLVADLKALTFCDAAGISELVESRFIVARTGRALLLTNVSPHLQRSFRCGRAASLLARPEPAAHRLSAESDCLTT